MRGWGGVAGDAGAAGGLMSLVPSSRVSIRPPAWGLVRARRNKQEGRVWPPFIGEAWKREFVGRLQCEGRGSAVSANGVES